jgi:hypothetical protein
MPVCAAAALAAVACVAPPAEPGGERYEDLVALFEAWREFERPALVDGVPDYSAAAMAAQHRELAAYQRRLAAIDTTDWPIAHRVDYHLVQAEMNGLDFDHRVRRPWARNPAFYTMIFAAQSDVPAHEGPVIHTWIDLWEYEYPLSPEAAADLAGRMRAIPPLLERARENLVEDARDLWAAGIENMRGQAADLDVLASRVAGTSGTLDTAIASARDATDRFRAWLEAQAPSKTGPSGVGKDNYSWYLQNVHLVPYTWEEEVTIMRRELARAHAALRLEEHRNRRLPPLRRVASAEEYDRAFNAAVTEYMAFLEEEEIVAIRPYMDQALRERIGRFTPAEGLRSFFSEVAYRDPVTMRTHGYHWIDLARMEHEPHASPIRRVPSLSNIFDARSEGLATGMEELMMHAGLFADKTRSRELIYILVAQRAARALGGLYLHANEWTMEEAVQFTSDWTPRGWLPADRDLVRFEQYLYLQQPGYGTSYLIGKLEIEKLIAERARQLGNEFSLRRFMGEFEEAGVIPVSLIRWEMTGDADRILQTAGAQ